MTIPHRSTFCWCLRGTRNEAMMMMKMKMLSMDSEYSVK